MLLPTVFVHFKIVSSWGKLPATFLGVDNKGCHVTRFPMTKDWRSLSSSMSIYTKIIKFSHVLLEFPLISHPVLVVIQVRQYFSSGQERLESQKQWHWSWLWQWFQGYYLRRVSVERKLDMHFCPDHRIWIKVDRQRLISCCTWNCPGIKISCEFKKKALFDG